MSSFLIEDAFQITGVGLVIVGKVLSGRLVPGMRAKINDKEIEIKFIEKNHQELSEARTGENVGISIKDISSSQGFFSRIFSGNGLYNLLKNSKGRQIEFH